MTKLLVLGGTAFVGHAVVNQALARGWEVTTFNRGLTGSDVDGVEVVRGDRTAPKDLARLATAGPWDAVVDLSGYVPRNVLSTAQTLEPLVDHYIFMSTVSVYADWPTKPLTEDSPVLKCPPDADENYGEDVEDGPTKYGYQKSGCENAVRLSFGESRTCTLRPGVVLGPREYVGRLPWWLRRVFRGGRILAPGSPERSIQPIDVRDLAAFACHTVAAKLSSSFNVTAPSRFATFGQLLEYCVDATNGSAKFAWAPDGFLLEHGVRQWSELPLWRTHAGVWQVDSVRAHSAGLGCRPLSETVRDTWEWIRTTREVANNERSNEIGISTEREREILSLLVT
ncbi:NAD-dependent epimerase/dehydratase family protein [Nonomuraea diastatica]|uniref:NAD-dependent epimerase/dehydratase family protein n=1 Tax=Nonomuraea diastatica TaxID=1848329 RepID=A0A4R4WRB7_9ACTN|nr:NAD-dependent epimerase/dehydratase family protein [Nonomuraea diastatica]